MTPTVTPSITTTPSVTPSVTPTVTPSPLPSQVYEIIGCCGSIAGVPPTTSYVEITVSVGSLPIPGDVVSSGGKCYYINNTSTNTPVLTIVDPPIHSDCEDCKSTIGEECLTNVLQGCSTGTYYSIINSINNNYVVIETGTTIQISMSNVVIPSGGLPENCFTGVYDSPTDVILGEIITTGNTTCGDASCAVTPTPTPTNSITPTVTPSISVSPSVTPSISITPSVTSTPVSPTPTPTNTPTNTPSPSDLTCEDFNFEVTQSFISVTPTTTPTPTPSSSIPRNTEGETVVFVIDSGYFECGDILKLQDCSDSNTYYFVNGPLSFNGSAITINDIFTAELNGEEKCVKYVSDTNGSSTHFINNISQLHSVCCIESPTPTPSITPTVTPSITPSVTPSTSPRADVVYVYTACSSNNMIVQTLETPNVLSGQTFLYNSSCWTYVGFFTIPYHEPVGYIRTDYSGNYFGVPGASYNSCGDCQSAPIITPSITPTPTPTPSIDIRLFNVESCCSGNQGVFQIIGNEILPEPPYTVNAYFWSGEDYTDRNLNTFECYEVLEEVTSGTVVETIPSSLFLDAIGYSGTTCQTGATQYNYTTIETISGATLIGVDIYEATVCSVTGMLYLPSYGIPGEDGQDIISESACGSISTGYCTSYTVTGATGSIVGWIDCDGEESFCGCDIEINLDFGVEYQSGSTRATFTVTSSKEVPNDLTVTFTNTIYDDVTSRDVSYEDVSVVISRGNTVGTTTVSDPTDYSDIYPYQTSYENVRTEGSGITINTINKYSSVVFDGKTPPLTRAYIFQDCCGYGNVKNLLVDTSAPWIINGYGVIIEGECYIPRAAGGSGADGEYYGPDFKDCTSRDCPPCVSPTPSVTPSVSITPSVSVTPTSTITPTVTPTNPYYLVCDVVTREYYLTCDVDTDEYLLSCDSEILLPTPSVTPTITTTPSVTPSLTTGDKTIYVYYPNI